MYLFIYYFEETFGIICSRSESRQVFEFAKVGMVILVGKVGMDIFDNPEKTPVASYSLTYFYLWDENLALQ